MARKPKKYQEEAYFDVTCKECGVDYLCHRAKRNHHYPFRHFCSKRCKLSDFIKTKDKDLVRLRFWSKVDKTPGLGPSGDCWEWRGSDAKNGYGQYSFEGSHLVAHRAALFLFGSRDPSWVFDPKILCCHTCDNRKCVNPKHLFLGKAIDNIMDMISKGRRNPGRSAVLNAKQVQEIRKLYRAKNPAISIAAQFNVTRSCIYSIVEGVTWKNLPEEED